jgi:hypothetical protein
VDAAELDYGTDMLAGELGWEKAFTSFREAQRALVQEMTEAGVDDEMIQLVKALKARDLRT